MKAKAFFNKILWACVALLLSLFCVFQSVHIKTATAEKITILSLDKTNVLDDLQGMTIDGEPFDLTDYAFDELRDIQVISFVEYCYSYRKDMQEHFGLYVYLWNPKGLSFEDDKTRNRIQFTYGEHYDVPVKYSLTILNKSEKKGYEGLFYKVKVDLSETDKLYILSSLNSVSRTYHISGIELLDEGKTKAVEYPIATTFTYSGFAKGFGADDSAESTLTCVREGNEVLELDVHHTYYRPNGSNGINSYTQDTLMTAYFSIPNNVLESYERLSGVACSWIKVMTDWIYVTGRKDIYDAFLNEIGVDHGILPWKDDNGTPYVGLDDKAFPYGFCATTVEGQNVLSCNYSGERAWETLDRLNYVFWTGSNNLNSADDYCVSSEDLKEWMNNYHQLYGQKNDKYLKVDGKEYFPYNSALFADNSVKTTNVTVSADESRSLTEEVFSQSWLQKMFGGADKEYSNSFDGIEAIKKVTDEDMDCTDGLLCNSLYINEKDIQSFKDFFEAEKRKGRIVFLLRYDIGEYQSIETKQGKPDNDGLVVGFDDGDTNGYVCREDVYLDFDVIHCEFERDNETVIIPVVSSPVDIVADTQPPIYTSEDNYGWFVEFFSWLLGIGLVVLGVIAVAIFAPWIFSLIGNGFLAACKFAVKLLSIGLKWTFKIIWFVVAFPWNLIFKGIKRKKNRP